MNPVKTVDNMSRDEKLVTCVVGMLDGFRDAGLITGGDRLTDEGRKIFDELQANGFYETITDAEIRRVMDGLLAKEISEIDPSLN